jgi:hypothetical protein
MYGPPGGKVAPVTTATGMPTKYNLSQYDDYGAAFDGQQPAPVVNRNMYGPPGGKVAPVTTAAGHAQTSTLASMMTGARPMMGLSSSPGRYDAPGLPRHVMPRPRQGSPMMPNAATTLPVILIGSRKWARGSWTLEKATLIKGFKDLTGGAGDLFMPSARGRGNRPLTQLTIKPWRHSGRKCFRDGPRSAGGGNSRHNIVTYGPGLPRVLALRP